MGYGVTWCGTRFDINNNVAYAAYKCSILVAPKARGLAADVSCPSVEVVKRSTVIEQASVRAGEGDETQTSNKRTAALYIPSKGEVGGNKVRFWPA